MIANGNDFAANIFSYLHFVSWLHAVATYSHSLGFRVDKGFLQHNVDLFGISEFNEFVVYQKRAKRHEVVNFHNNKQKFTKPIRYTRTHVQIYIHYIYSSVAIAA